MEEPTKTICAKYPVHVMKGRQFYKGICISALFFFIVAIHTVRDLGDNYIGADKPTHTLVLNKSIGQMSMREHRAGRGLMEWTSLEEEDADCEEVHDKDGKDEQCEFVKNTEDCQNEEGLLEYNHFIYCTLGGDLIPLAAVILVFWWLFCFCGLALCADDYFCPSLVVISKTLRLSPNVAGVTFLAFGNGAPDVFSALAALDSGGDPGLGLGGLLGAGIFVTTVVCGTIAIIRPFRVMQRPFLRDVIFYLGGIYWTFFILWKGYIYLMEAVGFLLVWVFYVIVVVASGSIYKQQKAKEQSKDGDSSGITLTEAKKLDDNNLAAGTMATLEKSPTTTTLEGGLDNPNYMPDFADPEEKKRYLERRTTLDDIVLNQEKPSEPMDAIKEGEEEKEGKVKGAEKNSYANFNLDLSDETGKNGQASDGAKDSKMKDVDLDIKANGHGDSKPDEDGEQAYEDVEDISPLRALVEALNPINLEEWPEMRWWARIYEVFKCPIVFVINISCPVVNYEVEETWNWNKYLFVLQSFVAPTMFVLCLQLAGEEIAGVFPVYGITLILGAIFAVIVWFTSEVDKRPRYIEVFGWIGFFIALGWIYVIANEVVAVLQSLGIVMKISTGILGLTLLAWGNSIGDWIADTVMARQGFARMGFAACFGGPFFNLSLGFGIPMVVSMARSSDSQRVLEMSPVNLMLTTFLMGALCLSLIFLVVRKFAANRPYGIVLLAYYVVFLVMALLAETEVIMKGWRPS